MYIERVPVCRLFVPRTPSLPRGVTEVSGSRKVLCTTLPTVKGRQRGRGTTGWSVLFSTVVGVFWTPVKPLLGTTRERSSKVGERYVQGETCYSQLITTKDVTEEKPCPSFTGVTTVKQRQETDGVRVLGWERLGF